jgi:dihydroorotate dehydrogenase (NAD+) catalytic subunit
LDFFAFELNLSCPHVKDVGSEIGSDPDEAAEVVSQVRKVTSKPLFAKMPANIMDVPRWAKSVEESGADAIVAINTARSMLIDVETRKPVLSHKFGGLSGPAIRPIAVRCVFEIYESVRIPVIGVGGVVDWKSAVGFLLAGASAVQIGSAMSTTFLGTFASVNKGIRDYIRRNDFSNVEELVGLAHE